MPALLTRREEAQALRMAAAQPESAGEFLEFIIRIRQRVVAAALADERLRERLADTRYRVLAVDYREDKPVGDAVTNRFAEVVLYDYDLDVLVVAVLDLREGSLVDVYERQGHAPPITSEELAEARGLLTEASGLAEAAGREDATVVAFPAPSYAFDGPRQRHRCCMVYLRMSDGALHTATVDLSEGAVVPDEELPEILRPDVAHASGRPSAQ